MGSTPRHPLPVICILEQRHTTPHRCNLATPPPCLLPGSFFHGTCAACAAPQRFRRRIYDRSGAGGKKGSGGGAGSDVSDDEDGGWDASGGSGSEDSDFDGMEEEGEGAGGWARKGKKGTKAAAHLQRRKAAAPAPGKRLAANRYSELLDVSQPLSNLLSPVSPCLCVRVCVVA